MLRTRTTSRSIRCSCEGTVIRVDFRSGRSGGADLLTKLSPVIAPTPGIPIALGVIWLVIMFAPIAFAHQVN